MPRLTSHRIRPPYLYRMLSLVCFVLLASTSINSQTTTPTDTTTPLALSPGSPAGSYAVSDFENVNPYNGNLSFISTDQRRWARCRDKFNSRN